MAIVWGPIAGYFAQRIKSPQLTVVPLKSEPGVRFDYQMAMGVRYGEGEWKQKIEGLIESQQAAIQSILREYGVPLVDASFEAPRALGGLALGSGVAVAPGQVVTNCHVTRDATEIRVVSRGARAGRLLARLGRRDRR